MIHRNICPICGNENPEGSQFCQVCSADLQTLPEELFPVDHVPAEQQNITGSKQKSAEDQEFDPNRSIPVWLIDRFRDKGKQGKSPEKMDFDAFNNILFGVPDENNSASPEKVLAPQSKKVKKDVDSVYQPSLESTFESPLIEEDDGASKSVSADFPVLHDFKTVRPVKKWDDPEETVKAENVREQADREFGTAAEVPSLWSEEAPLIEEDGDISKGAGEYDSEFANSVSPTKVIGSEETSGMAQNAEFQAASVTEEPAPPQSEEEEFQPESGSLISDLMNVINSNAGMPAPSESKANSEGTVFFSGNEGQDEENPASDVLNIPPESETAGGSAVVLDQILRRIGYSVDDGSQADESTPEIKDTPSPAEDTTPEPDPPLVIETNENEQKKPETGMGFEENPALGMELDPALVETDDDSGVSDKNLDGVYGPYDGPDDTEIPWDLFEAADMSLPQLTEESGYRTFSRTGIPEDSGATTYQQRMLSSVLGKIIHAENYVPPEKAVNNRKISFWARIFWCLLAFGGVLMFLMSEIGNKISLPELSQSENARVFWQTAEKIQGDAMLVVDYTPSYASVLDPAADKLIEALSENTDQILISALNPAAMTTVQRILENHDSQVSFGGWWPAGVISIRARLAEGSLPDQIWLITSESSSVRTWAEQLAVTDGNPGSLYVMAPGQLAPILSAYQNSGMVSGFYSEDRDPVSGADNGRIQLAVLYLAALLPLAWLIGFGGRFLKTDPDFRKKDALPEMAKPETAKETEDD